MGFTARSKSAEFYGVLLHAYPYSFRKHYGTTMLQTFTDMLDNERSTAGRLSVWLRTLIDLPFSALKEHITNGEKTGMNRTIKLMLAAAIAAIAIVGIGSFWFGTLSARKSVGIERVSVVQLADAMQQDHFYSDYGDAALLFSAKVSSVETGDDVTLVTFTTNRPYNVRCQFARNLPVKTDQVISVAAPGGSADREKHGVLLHNCLEN